MWYSVLILKQKKDISDKTGEIQMNSSLANNNELMLISFDKPIQQERETG